MTFWVGTVLQTKVEVGRGGEIRWRQEKARTNRCALEGKLITLPLASIARVLTKCNGKIQMRCNLCREEFESLIKAAFWKSRQHTQCCGKKYENKVMEKIMLGSQGSQHVCKALSLFSDIYKRGHVLISLPFRLIYNVKQNAGRKKPGVGRGQGGSTN